MTTFSRRFEADHRSLSDLRAVVRSWLERHTDSARLPEGSVGDVDLIATELAANVIDHTASPWVELTITTNGPALTVEVTQQGDAAELPAVEAWGVIEHGDRGRGLRIVRALCDTIDVRHGDGATSIRCRLIS